MLKPVTQKLIAQLKKSDLSLEDRVALTTALLDKLNALPIGDMITLAEDGLMINGKELDIDATLNFREACATLKDNYARKVIFEQVRYKAIDMGINKALTIDTLMFSKAAIWSINELEILIHKLSTEA